MICKNSKKLDFGWITVSVLFIFTHYTLFKISYQCKAEIKGPTVDTWRGGSGYGFCNKKNKRKIAQQSYFKKLFCHSQK